VKSCALTRPVYRHAELDRVLNPKNICIVGASPKSGSFGERVLTNLCGFGGKINSRDIAHKTEAGGVALNLRFLDELRAAFQRVITGVQRFAPQAKISGVLLRPMVPVGIEVVEGARVDPLLGPLIVVGFGGVS
jgi:acyl-CoA synthetase (NDP forming)